MSYTTSKKTEWRLRHNWKLWGKGPVRRLLHVLYMCWESIQPSEISTGRHESKCMWGNGQGGLDFFSGVLLLLIPVTWKSQNDHAAAQNAAIKFLNIKCSYWLPAVYTGEEDSLSFICRPHLPGVVNHPFFITTRAASVNLKGAGNLINTVYSCYRQQQSVSSRQDWSYHRSLQFRVLLVL